MRTRRSTRCAYGAVEPRIRNRNSWPPHEQYCGRRNMPSPTAKRSARIVRVHFPRRCSSQFTECGADDKSQLAGFGNCGTPAQYGVVLAFDGVQYFLTAAAEEFDVDGQRTVDLSNQRHALREPFPRKRNFKLQHLAECGR